MKVYINSNKKKFFIILPTALFLNRLTATIASKVLKSKYPEFFIEAKDFMKFIFAVKKYKKTHKHICLVDVSSHDGEKVYVSL